MINFEKQRFTLKTKNTSYIFELLETGHLRHLYYGDSDSICYLRAGRDIGDTVAYNQDKKLFLEDELLEVSTTGKGDIKEPFIQLINADGSLTSDFLYISHDIDDIKPELRDLPVPCGECEHLCIKLKDYHFNLFLYLHYAYDN